MTKRELIYIVFEKLNISSDDIKTSEELVSTLIDSKRAMLIKQQYSKNSWNVPIEIRQELCLDLELTDRIEGYGCSGKILATKLILPRSIKIKGKDGPLSVRKQDGVQIALNIIPFERVPYLFENRFTQKMLYATVDFNNRLFMISKDDKHRFIKWIKVTDVFERPEIASVMECSVDQTLDVWDIDYPIEEAMADAVVDLVVKDLTRSLGIPEDKINDAQDGRTAGGR